MTDRAAVMRVVGPVVAAALVAAGCPRAAAPSAAPLPAPQGAPPQVKSPVTAPSSTTPPQTAPALTSDPSIRRFDVVSVEDSTFTILIGNDHWVRRGMSGIAVDPRRHDALVAQFRVLGRTGDSATALVTGQTTRLVPAHVALIRRPLPGLFQQQVFWAGLIFGLTGGVLAWIVTRH